MTGPLSPDENRLFSDLASLPSSYWERLPGSIHAFPFLGYPCTVDVPARSIAIPGFPVAVSFQAGLVILSWLHAGKGAPSGGAWALAQELKGGLHFFDASHPLTTSVVLDAAAGESDLLRQAFDRLGGRRLDVGDISAELDVLPGIAMRYVFWDGGDEFPSSLTVNFQKGVEEILAPDVLWAMANVVHAVLAAVIADLKGDA